MWAHESPQRGQLRGYDTCFEISTKYQLRGYDTCFEGNLSSNFKVSKQGLNKGSGLKGMPHVNKNIDAKIWAPGPRPKPASRFKPA